ncbi:MULTISPECIES: DUF2213 domain-containing protein [unclassified Desulfovibrio]|uniref:DUF2213 domain-containing protein n=1 Tax=unclassified Desulfovibrio TaxID=2593640 RepID=UPI002FDB5D94
MTRILKKEFINRAPARFTDWRIDDDGFLRVTAVVLKEGVYPYGADEAGTAATLPGIDPVQQYIPASEFTEKALDSLEGKPVVINAHEWRDAGNALVDGLTIGAVAGRPYMKDGEIVCDFLIMDQDTIRKVQNGELVEVSSGYNGTLVVGEGSFGGRHYHGTQTDLEFNHVLLLPEGMGRCGYDVRIINSREPYSGKQSEGAGDMPTTLKVTVGNRARSYKFQNEEDAAQAEEMLNEEKAFNAEAVSAAIAAKTDLEGQISELQKQLAEHDQHLADAKKQIEELLTPAAQEAMAEEFVEQKDAEDAIIDAETDNMEGGNAEADEEKEEFGNALKKCNSMAERRKVTVARVMNMRGLKVDDWNQDAFDGAFEILAANAKAKAKSKEKTGRVLNGSRTPGKGGSQPANNRERMLRPMKARNAKPESK